MISKHQSHFIAKLSFDIWLSLYVISLTIVTLSAHDSDSFTFPDWRKLVFELVFTPYMLIKKTNNFAWSYNFDFSVATLHSAKYSDKMKTCLWQWPTKDDLKVSHKNVIVKLAAQYIVVIWR